MGTSDYLYTVTIYDENGRVIQVKSKNITNGIDIATTQYDFSGKVLRTHVAHQKAGANPNIYQVLTVNNYDNLGRVSSVTKRTNSNSTNVTTDKVVAQMNYNQLGQMKTKTLGNSLETQNYDYNIRGWLLGMNRDYIKDVITNYFGFDLGYDKNGVIGSYAGMYNGNISGTVWKSAGDGEKRKYDFTYDAVNRITGADFNEWVSGSGSAAVFNRSKNIDFRVGNIAYDDNGNILSMWQYGWKPGANVSGGTTLIDKLNYTYFDNSNKLKNVIDEVNDPSSKLGDFRSSQIYMNSLGSKTVANRNIYSDYSYDANGNLKKDLNKDIGTAIGDGITYNHLNLPSVITLAGNRSITYVYDALGNKLKKTVIEPGQLDKTTLYMFGTYENDVLQFLPQEEGRVRPVRDGGGSVTGFVNDYFIKDHLGNVRMVLTEEQNSSSSSVSFEDAALNNEQAVFENVDVSRVPKPIVGSEKAQLLLKAGNTVGAGKLLKVMAGDRIHVQVDYYTPTVTTDNSQANGLSTVINSLTSLLSSGKASAILKDGAGAVTNDLNNSNEFTSFLSNQNSSVISPDPKAFLNILFFDEQFRFVSAGSESVQVSAKGAWTQIQRILSNAKRAEKSGYVYIYLSNESNNNVYFDNLMISHERGPLLEETHYYPFGLTMLGISSHAIMFGGAENKYKYNGIVSTNDFDINIYDARFRNLDPQIGRFGQLDPKPSEMLSSYSAMANNPLLYSDPLGDTTWIYNQNGVFCGVVNDKLENQVHYIKTDFDPTSPGDFSKLTLQQATSLAKSWRSISIAFIGSKTVSDMKAIVNKSVKEKVEIAFVGEVGKDKEIRLTALPIDKGRVADGIQIDKGNQYNQVPSGRQIDENYSVSQQSKLFLEGHTHIKEWLNALKYPTAMKEYLKVGLPNQSPTKSEDYSAVLDRGSGKGAAPSLILTPLGITLYGTTHMTPMYEPSPNNTYLSFQRLK